MALSSKMGPPPHASPLASLHTSVLSRHIRFSSVTVGAVTYFVSWNVVVDLLHS